MKRQRKPRRTSVTEARSIRWLHNTLSVSSLSSAYALEREIYQKRFSAKDFGGTSHPNFFSNYENGTSPTEEVISAVEARYPGTAKVRYHQLWPQLETGLPVTHTNALASLSKLARDVTSILDWGKEGSQKVAPLGYTPSRGKQIASFANLDAFCTLLIVWQLATSYKNWNVQQAVATDIYRLLLAYGIFTFEYDCVNLFKLFRSKVFNQTNWGPYSFQLDSNDFFDTVEILRRMTLSQEDISLKKQRTTSTLLMGMFASPYKHYAIFSLANNYLGLSDNALPPEKSTLNFLTYNAIRRDWAYEYICGCHTQSLVERIIMDKTLDEGFRTYYLEISWIQSGNKELITERVTLLYDEPPSSP